MIQKVLIKRISRQEKTSKAGKTYTSLGIQVAEHGERFINGFGNKLNRDWKEGDEVKIDIKEVELNGKKYLNFEMVDTTGELISRVQALEETVGKMKIVLKPMWEDWKKEQEIPKDDYPVSTGEPNFDQLDDPLNL